VSLDLTAFSFAMKEYYTDDEVQRVTYEDHPFFAQVAKDEKFFGKVLPVPLIYGNPQGRSASIAKAVANQTASKGVEFLLTRAKDYMVATIDNETMEASENDEGAFMEAAIVETDGSLSQLSDSISISLFGNGGGALGQIANSAFNTPTITLTDPYSVVNFEVGMSLDISVDDGTGGNGVRTATGTPAITAIDRAAGTITLGATNLSTWWAAVAQNDYIFVQGDYNAKLKGLAAWIPYTTPTSTAFFGVDRTPDPVRLAGVRYDASSLPIEEALVELVSRVEQIGGGHPDVGYLNPAQWRSLEKALGARVQYVNPTGDALVGFTGIRIAGKKGPCVFYADNNCPNTRAYALTSKTWKLRTLGKPTKLFKGDGLQFLRGSTTDDLQFRVQFYGNLACNAPGWNGVANLTAAP